MNPHNLAICFAPVLMLDTSDYLDLQVTEDVYVDVDDETTKFEKTHISSKSSLLSNNSLDVRDLCIFIAIFVWMFVNINLFGDYEYALVMVTMRMVNINVFQS